MNDHHRPGRQAGFTLIEIMVVIVILGLLFGIVAPQVLGNTEEARIGTAKMEVKTIHDACNQYLVMNPGRVPQWEQLIEEDDRGFAYIPDLSEPKVDPWNNEYRVTSDPEFDHKPYVYSCGPDGIDDQGQNDDISNKNLRSYGKKDT